jgi:hypothetical protein
MERLARPIALGIALMALAALLTRTGLSMQEDGRGLGPTLWALGRYFTILTNLLVVVGLGAWGLGAHRIGPSLLAALTLAIGIVGVVFHLLLADLQDLQGLPLLVDHVFHTAVPLATALWWLTLAPKHPIPATHPLLWLIWPLAYAVYAILRGLADGIYPYPFLNPEKLGWAGLAQSMAGLLVAFALAGYAMWGLARWLRPGQSAKPS